MNEGRKIERKEGRKEEWKKQHYLSFSVSVA
jgi:hypothetical protein